MRAQYKARFVSPLAKHILNPMLSHVTLTEDILLAAKSITDGRVVAVPTGTSYALAADALQGWAIQRVRILKDRPDEKSFTVFMAPHLWDTYLDVSDAERSVLERMSDMPLTLLVKPQAALSHLAIDGRIGVRLIDHPLMAELAQKVAVPLTATSANRSGQTPCQTPECIVSTWPSIVPDDQLREQDPRGASGTTYNLSLAVIVDGGVLPAVEPTTIAQLDGDQVRIIRQGQLQAADIQLAD